MRAQLAQVAVMNLQFPVHSSSPRGRHSSTDEGKTDDADVVVDEMDPDRSNSEAARGEGEAVKPDEPVAGETTAASVRAFARDASMLFNERGAR